MKTLLIILFSVYSVCFGQSSFTVKAGGSNFGFRDSTVVMGINSTTQTSNFNPTDLFGGKPTLVGGFTIGSGTALGYKSQATSKEATALGQQAQANCLACIAIGDGTKSTAGTFAGNGSITSGVYGNQIVMGDAAFTNGNLNVFIGGGSGINHDYAMAIGGFGGSTSYSLSQTTASHQAMMGWYDTTSGYFNNGVGLYNDWYFGGPVRSSSAAIHGINFNISSATGTNIAGTDWTFNASKATGTAASGKLIFTTSSGGSSGTTLQTATNKLVIDSGGVAMGSNSTAATAILDITSTLKGVLLPRMTTTQRNAISSPAEGLLVYDLTLHKYYSYDGTTWNALW